MIYLVRLTSSVLMEILGAILMYYDMETCRVVLEIFEIFKQ